MGTPMSKNTRKQDVPQAIRLVWDSLDSHLDSTVGRVHKRPCCNKAVGSPAFHKKCVQEYMEVLRVLVGQL